MKDCTAYFVKKMFPIALSKFSEILWWLKKVLSLEGSDDFLEIKYFILNVLWTCANHTVTVNKRFHVPEIRRNLFFYKSYMENKDLPCLLMISPIILQVRSPLFSRVSLEERIATFRGFNKLSTLKVFSFGYPCWPLEKCFLPSWY